MPWLERCVTSSKQSLMWRRRHSSGVTLLTTLLPRHLCASRDVTLDVTLSRRVVTFRRIHFRLRQISISDDSDDDVVDINLRFKLTKAEAVKDSNWWLGTWLRDEEAHFLLPSRTVQNSQSIPCRFVARVGLLFNMPLSALCLFAFLVKLV